MGKYFSPKSPCDLENEVKVTKTQIALKLVPMIYPGKFGGIPSTGSRDILGTRICHADTDADAKSPHFFGVGEGNIKKQAFEMRCYRRLLNISYNDCITNE